MSQATAIAATAVCLPSRAAPARRQWHSALPRTRHTTARLQQQWRTASTAEHPSDHPPVVLKTGDEGEELLHQQRISPTNSSPTIADPPALLRRPPPPLPPARSRACRLPVPHPPRLRPASQPPDIEELSQEYTDVMQQRMGSAALTYRHEDGMNYRCLWLAAFYFSSRAAAAWRAQRMMHALLSMLPAVGG